MTNVNISNAKVEMPKFDPDNYIWNNNPTRDILDKCKSEDKILCSFIDIDDKMVFNNKDELDILLHNFLNKHGLEASHYHFIWFTVRNIDKEQQQRNIMSYLKRTYEDPARPIKFGVTGFIDDKL